MDEALALSAHSSVEPGEQKTPSLPSCELCRQRKIRCDRTNPCSNCQRAGSNCVFPALCRLPRGRQGGRRKANNELLHRIAKLENLVRNMEGHSSSPTSTSSSQGTRSHVGMMQQPSLSAVNPTGTRKTSKDFTGRNLDRPFLRIISDEISGLRYVLGSSHSDDDDNDFDDDECQDGHGDGVSEHSRFVICGPGWLSEQVGISQYPSPEQQLVLCEAYMVNVHTVAKILHGPSLQDYLHGTKQNLECSPGPRGLEALHYAVFHAAATSLTNVECRKKLGEPKQVLVSRYRLATELALAKADFLNTTEISTLQALVSFVQAVRAYDQSRFSWTLISVCVRIAQALGLHLESNLTSLPLFQREMRRRLWWQIAVLDSSMSQDRGTYPAIGPGSYDTKVPLHINDSDIWLGGPKEVVDRESYTEMTFCSIVYDVYEAVRVLNFVLPREAAGPGETQVERVERVLACQERLEKRFLRHLDMSIPFHRGAKMVADCIRACLWLYVYRPLQQRNNFGAEIQHPSVLHLSVDIMEKSKMTLTHPATASFHWLSTCYLPWHPLAIALSELCIQTDGLLVERAWASVDHTYGFVAKHVADGVNGALFRPIRRLMAKAKKVRQKHLADVGIGVNVFPDFRKMEIGETAAAASLDFSSVPTDAMNNSGFPNEWLKTPDLIQGGFNWDPWLIANASSPGVLASKMSFWDNFVMEFQGQQDFGTYDIR